MASQQGVPAVVVVGGSNTDLKARCLAPVVGATSNPGTTTSTPGGVGRNIAENLARLGTTVHLVSAVGDDALGHELLAATALAGVDVSGVHVGERATGSYTAVLDHTGELVVAVADMEASAEVLPAHVEAAAEHIAAAALVVLDGNLAPDTLVHAASLAAAAGVGVVVEPVSVAKARTLVLGRHPVHTLTPNADELAAVTGLPTTTEEEVEAAVVAVQARGVERVWVRLGERGSLLAEGRTRTSLDAVGAVVLDVTGAGDAMTAAYCHALVRGASTREAAELGHRAAAATLATPSTVHPDLALLLEG